MDQIQGVRPASAITATGGEGAAGIGGGKDGGVDDVTIALERTDLSNMHTQYVTATGGLGAAGIGSGAGGHDVGSVTIQSGYVTAKGGTDLDGKGTGAGIGGGNAKGALKNLSISGGYINASAGSSDAYDIGCGGTNGALSTDQNGAFTISGGTVLATNIGYAKTMIVTGGSVLANLTNAYNAAHNPVYRTTLTLPIGGNTEADLSSFVDGYGTNDIYSDANRKVYLYRTTTDEFKASADVKTAYQATAYHYIGQTLADGSGMLKIQPQFSFKDPEATLAVGDTFKIYVDDSQLTNRWGDCVYTVSGCASETNNPPSNTRHVGAYASLIANSIGAYTVTATCAVPPESADTYWPVEATYTGTVTQQTGVITITEDPSKIYDGQAVADPSVTTTGDGAVTYTYYTGTDISVAGAKLEGAPVDQGTYTVVASMAGTDHYTAASTSKSFTITPRPITLGLSASLSGDTATLTATVLNAVDAQGDVEFTITKPDNTTKVVTGEIAASGDTYVAQASFTGVDAGTYNVVATYSPAMSGDYSCADTASASFNKEYVTRSINVDSSVTATYGDSTFNLNAIASTSEGATDQFAYEVSSDEFAAYGLNPTILVDAAGNVTPTNAGVATVKITLTDSSNHYAPATAYVKVTVTRAKLTVTPYVKDSSGSTITAATYGSLGGLTYGLTFVGLKGEDKADTFTGGHGTLEAVPLATTADAGNYTIGIKRVGDGSVTINGTTYYSVFVSRNYEITEGTNSFTVNPATLTVTANDATGTWGGTEPAYGVTLSGFVLDDTASSVFSTQPTAALDTTQTGGKAFSALEPGTYAKAVKADAGTQNANSNSNDEGNYYNYTVQTVPGTLTVTKADSALAISVDSKTYDGKAVNDPTVTTSTDPKFDGTCTVTYYPLDSATALSGAPTDAGQYRAVATVKDAAHFANASAGCTFTISKATPNPDSPTLTDLTYQDGMTLAVNQPFLAGSGWTWDNPDTVLSAGTVKANATYTPSDTTNYTTVTRTLTFEVTEATGSITSIADPSKTYDGTAVADPEVKSTNNAKVTYAWYVRTEPYATLLPSAPTDAGDYLVAATVADDGNHTSVTGYQEFTISKATPNPDSPTLTDLTYQDGMTLAANQPLPAGSGWTWDNPDTALSAGTVKANATYTPTDTVNYNTVARELTFTVNQAAGSIKITGDPSKTYDGKAVSDPTVEKSGTGAVTYAYYAGTDTTVAPLASAPKDAGGYTVVATVADDGNHTSATDSKAFTIAKATPTVDTPTVSDVTYKDGLTIADLTLPSGWTWDAPTTALSAGTVKANATYTPADTANYETVTRELTFTVTQAAGSISITGDPSKTYDGAAVSDPAVEKSGTGAVTFAYYAGSDTTANPLASAPVDAGSYTVVATVADDGNYKTATASKAFTISKATPDVETPAVADVTYKDGLTLADLALPDGWAWDNPTTVLSAGTVRANATYTPTDTANYETVTRELTFTVSQAAGSVKITGDPSKTYDGTAVSDPAVEKSGTGTVTFAYYAGSDTTAAPLASAPKDAGDYTVVATVADDGNHTSATDSRAFTIAKATPEVTSPTLTDLTYQDGMTLAANQPLPAGSGWTWDNPDAVLSAGTVKADATYTPSDTANYNTVTRTLSFEVTKAAGSISITGDPSKTYDGAAVADPAVSTEGTGAVTFAYYAGSDTTANPLASAPVDAGSYTVVATVADDGNYKTAAASKAFTISKATPDVETPALSSIIYQDGLILADESLPANWSWNEPKRSLSVGHVDASATYTPTDTTNYDTVTRTLSFEVLEGQGTVSITEDVSKTYDGSPVETPAVSTTGDGAVTFSYYAGADITAKPLASAPVDAGTYTVVATLAETKSYKGASDSKSFEIRKAPIVLNISATQNGTSAAVTVTALGMVSADGSAEISVPNASGTAVTKKVAFAQTASGSFEATATFDSVASGTYTVSASYAAGTSGNYTCEKDATATFDKTKATRTIDVASSFAKTYGDSAFALGAKASPSLTSDAFAYEVVQDSFEAYGFDPCVSVDGSGNVTVKNAGSCYVKITLTDSTSTYNDAVAYVKVTVARAALKVTSFAASGNTHVTEAAYGSLGSLDYGIGYEGLENGDTPEGFTNGHGTLEARDLDERSIVATDPYAIPIDQVTSSGLTPTASGSDLFLSRNYAITYQLGTLTVTPAQLVVSATDASGEWHGTEPGYGTSVDGLASWDSTDSVFTTKPTASLDTTKTGGKTYDQLEPGTYANVISVASTGTLRKNVNGLENYTVTAAAGSGTEAGTLTVTSATPDVETPTLPDLTMRAGLTLADQALPAGWSWADPTRVLSVGHVEAEAIYTPSDTTHYSSVTRTLSFEVIDEPAAPDDSASSDTAAQTSLSHVASGASATPATGDGAPAALALAVTALAGAALVLVGIRRRAARR